MSERAFVVGATGLTGRAVVRHLVQRGVQVVAHVRADSARMQEHERFFAELGVEVDRTEWNEAAFTATLTRHRPHVIFALLGTTQKRKRDRARAGQAADDESYEAVDYGLTALVRRAAEATGLRPRFVYLSCTGIDPKKNSGNAYMQARVRIERELAGGDLPYTCVRPAMIHGDRDETRVGEAIGAAIGDGALALAGLFGARRLRDRYRSITGDELARACVRLAFDPEAEDRAFEPDQLR